MIIKEKKGDVFYIEKHNLNIGDKVIVKNKKNEEGICYVIDVLDSNKIKVLYREYLMYHDDNLEILEVIKPYNYKTPL